MKYSFNPHCHVKIWLSKEPDLFLAYENQLRLIEMRQKNTNDKISLLYSQDLLSEKAHAELKLFCYRNRIIPVSIEENIAPRCKTSNEQALLACYQQEVFAFKNGNGNPAAASDILRWINSVYELGVYSDFDVKIDTKALPPLIEVDSPLLLNLGSFFIPRRAHILSLNNNVIAVVNNHAANIHIESIQNSILSAYQLGESDFTYNAYVQACVKELSAKIPHTFVHPLKSIFSSHIRTTTELDALRQKFGTPISIRGQLKHERDNDPHQFIMRVLRILGFDGTLNQEEPLISRAVDCFRRYLKDKTGWLAWFTMPRNEYKSIRAKINLGDDALCKAIMDEIYTILYMQTVTGSTGPLQVLMAIFKQTTFEPFSFNIMARPFAFSHYGLQHAFQLDHGLPLDASIFKVLETFAACDKPSEHGNLSWTSQGVMAQNQRGALIKAQIKRLPQQFLELKTEIEVHKKAIERSVQRCFGFYRKKVRVAKIDALNEVLNYFAEGYFNVAAFTQAVAHFPDKHMGFDATIGQNTTKKLIEKCSEYALLAIHYSMLDKHAPKHLATLQKFSLVPGKSSIWVNDYATQSHFDMNDFALSYLDPLIKQGSKYFINNVETQAMLLKINNIVFPCGLNNKEYNSSYVCSIYNALVSYSAEESHKLNNPILEYIIRAAITAQSMILKVGKIDKNLFVNNYLLSTNLYPNWSGEGIEIFTSEINAQYPAHAIIFRSLNYHTNAKQLSVLKKVGYQLIPTRQVYIFDTKLKNYNLTRDLKKDRNIRKNSKYTLIRHKDISVLDFPRIVALYNMLYLEKYSQHNPQYNSAMMKHWHENNLLHILALKSPEGSLDGVIGIFENETTVSAPLVGYDTNLPQELGLYRQLISLVIDYASQNNKILNLSSGASNYKLNRGGQPFIEYAAVYTKHLPFYRRAIWRLINILLTQVFIRILKAYKL